MRVLVLGPAIVDLSPILGADVIGAIEHPVSREEIKTIRPDYLVSYRYQHIVSPDVLGLVNGRSVNLHVSLLPWNRGADPNLWSWLTHSPKGVSVHWMVAGLDRGDLVAQRGVTFDDDETLRSSYDRLQREVLQLFAEVWPELRSGSRKSIPQAPGGTYHRASDKNEHAAALSLGWETPCHVVEDYGRRQGLWVTD